MQHYAFNFQCYEHISIIFVTPCSDHDHVIVLTTYLYLVLLPTSYVYIYIIFCSILYSSVIEICIISRTSISFKALIPGSMTNKYTYYGGNVNVDYNSRIHVWTCEILRGYNYIIIIYMTYNLYKILILYFYVANNTHG